MSPDRSDTSLPKGVSAVLQAVERAGANLTVVLPGDRIARLGGRPDAARVTIHAEGTLQALAEQDLTRVAEGYLTGEVDAEGDFLEIMKITDVILPDPGWLERMRFWARLLLRDRRRLQRESISFHYDRPAEFFLPWFERWRSYSHGLYASDGDAPDEAQERKLRLALERLAVKPGDRVFDMGCGWGSFLEYAGLQGIHVHGITISHEQERFVRALIAEQDLPCTVERVDFLDFEPAEPFDGAVFMGTFEHLPDYRFAASFLGRWLRPEARVWADFCTARGSRLGGAFLKKYVWPGHTRYVDVPALLEALDREGFNIHELADDTVSYARTVRDWADAFEQARTDLEEGFGREPTRAFHLFLRASEYFLAHNKTQAYHLVAGRRPAGLRPAASRQASVTARQANANESPTRA